MKIRAWLCSSLDRQFPRGKPGTHREICLLAARGERLSFQVGLRLDGPAEFATLSLSAHTPAGLEAQVRRVECVPVRHFNTETPVEELDGVGHIPGYVPDILRPENTTVAVRGEVSAFWITLQVDPDARPGAKTVRLTLTGPGTLITLTARIQISSVRLLPRRDFRVTHWFYADAIADWYRIEPFSKAFWPICGRYFRNYVEHGNDTLYVPVFTPPLDGVKRPTQLLGVTRIGPDHYRFDWSAVEKWIKLARQSNVKYFEWVHLFSQWGAKYALRIYQDRNDPASLLWRPETAATSPTYRKFLAQFLPELHRFATSHGLLKRSFFHVSDEPTGPESLARYRAARTMLRELAPWLKVMDALSEIEYAKERLTDLPIPITSATKSFREKGIECWTYFCCGPRGRYLNRLLDTPLAKVRMAGWLFYRFGCGGFLHWGYNYWQKRQRQELVDPFCVTDADAWPAFAYGDPFVVYPGVDGPLDSIRWEVFAESLQDYALLQTQQVDPSSKILAPLKDFADFPRNARWLAAARTRLLVRP